jgi:mono/diheme cytochrome c family protein
MKQAFSVAIVCVSLCAAVACRKDEPKRSTPVHEHMQAHFDAIVGIRDALIDGNLESAKQKARWIVENDADPGIASWRESVAEIRRWSADLVHASGIQPAAAAGAELARACGRCHAGNGVSPDLGVVEPPLAASGTVPHMRRHHWAAERMWEGLVGPSEARWNAGTAELAVTPLTPDVILAKQSAAPAITDLANEVHALGKQARGIPATAWDTRSAMYARFLSTCAACHQAMR